MLTIHQRSGDLVTVIITLHQTQNLLPTRWLQTPMWNGAEQVGLKSHRRCTWRRGHIKDLIAGAKQSTQMNWQKAFIHTADGGGVLGLKADRLLKTAVQTAVNGAKSPQ